MGTCWSGPLQSPRFANEYALWQTTTMKIDYLTLVVTSDFHSHEPAVVMDSRNSRNRN